MHLGRFKHQKQVFMFSLKFSIGCYDISKEANVAGNGAANAKLAKTGQVPVRRAAGNRLCTFVQGASIALSGAILGSRFCLPLNKFDLSFPLSEQFTTFH